MTERKPHIYSETKTETVYHKNDGRDPRCAGCGDSVSTQKNTYYYCSKCNYLLGNRYYKFCPHCGTAFTGRFENRTLNRELAEIKKEQKQREKEVKAKERAEYERLKAKFEGK